MHSRVFLLNFEPNSAVPHLPISTLMQNTATQRVNNPSLLHDAWQHVCAFPTLASNPGHQTLMSPSSSAKSTLSLEHPRLIHGAYNRAYRFLKTTWGDLGIPELTCVWPQVGEGVSSPHLISFMS